MTCPVCLTEFAADCPRCTAPSQEPLPWQKWRTLRGVWHPHALDWGDAYCSYLRCKRCGTGFPPNSTLLDVMAECSGYPSRSWEKPDGGLCATDG